METPNDSLAYSMQNAVAPAHVPPVVGIKLPHISVCICTYMRPELLQRLLDDLRKQDTAGQFTFSIVIADNDHLKSAEGTVAEFATGSSGGSEKKKSLSRCRLARPRSTHRRYVRLKTLFSPGWNEKLRRTTDPAGSSFADSTFAQRCMWW